MSYVDGFVLAVPKAKLDDYKKLANLAGPIWMEHGALAYVECIGDDVPYGEVTSFPRAVQAKDDEVVIFSLGRLRIQAESRCGHGQGDGRSSPAVRLVDHAVRRQAHDLRRLPAVHGALSR